MYSALILMCTLGQDCYTITNDNLFETEYRCKQAIHEFTATEYFEPVYMRFKENTMYYIVDTKCVSWTAKI